MGSGYAQPIWPPPQNCQASKANTHSFEARCFVPAFGWSASNELIVWVAIYATFIDLKRVIRYRTILWRSTSLYQPCLDTSSAYFHAGDVTAIGRTTLASLSYLFSRPLVFVLGFPVFRGWSQTEWGWSGAFFSGNKDGKVGEGVTFQLLSLYSLVAVALVSARLQKAI
jgi:hypothetical protein